MFVGLQIIHRKSRESFGTCPQDALVWKTCLRQLVFLYRPSQVESFMGSGDELYKEADAYRFCLEVICGLHSPMIGETEVLGQFRNFFKAVSPDFAWSGPLQKWVQSWLADAKKVREEFLLNLGSQSYGSVVRRYLKNIPHVTLLGAGHLTGEILPWVLKENAQVEVVARRREVLEKLTREFPGVQGSLLSHWHRRGMGQNHPRGLVICAPLTGAQLARVVEGFDLIIDLRGESANDPIANSIPTVGLSEVFNQVSANQTQAREKAAAAQKRIAEVALASGHRVENRPFGWDDLCA